MNKEQKWIKEALELGEKYMFTYQESMINAQNMFFTVAISYSNDKEEFDFVCDQWIKMFNTKKLEFRKTLDK